MRKPTNKAPLRVLFVHRWGTTMGGGEQWIAEMSRFLRRKVVEPVAALHTMGPLVTVLQRNNTSVNQIALDWLRGGSLLNLLKSSFGLAQTVWRLTQLANRLRADLLHAFSPEAAEASYLAGLLLRSPVVVTVMNCGPFPIFDVAVLRRVDKVIAISRAVESDLLDAGVARERIELIPLGIRALHYSEGCSSRFRDEFGIRRDAPLIGMIAHLEPKKAQEIFLRAAKEISVYYRRAVFVLVGSDKFSQNNQESEYLRQLRKIAQQTGISEQVIFTGYRGDVPDILKALDVVVMPSHREAQGLAAIEAMAAGTPVVATAIEGLVDFIADEETGLLVPPDNAGALAHAIVRLLEDEKLRDTMVRSARVKANEYDAEKLVLKNEAVYRQLVEHNGLDTDLATS